MKIQMLFVYAFFSLQPRSKILALAINNISFVLLLLDSMSCRPTNSSSKELDDVIQTAHKYIEDTINLTHHQMDEQFHEAS